MRIFWTAVSAVKGCSGGLVIGSSLSLGNFRFCVGFSDACMTSYPRAPTAGVRKAPRQEIAGGGPSRMQRALWRFSRSGDVAGGGSGRAERVFQPAVVGERGGSRA